MFIRRTFWPPLQPRSELAPLVVATPNAPANVFVRGLSEFEKSLIDNAVKAALKQLPQRLAREMATLPPANKEIAKLYQTSVPQLQADRRTAVNMIALHAVIEKLIETRNEHWCRADRQDLSDQIDTHARESILREISCLRGTQKSTEVCSNGLPHYVVGVSHKEKRLLTQMTAAFMKQCIQTIPKSKKKAAATNRLNDRPVDEHKKVYANFSREMGQAFSDLFNELDRRVRAYDKKNGALVGVDQRKLRALAGDLIAHQKAKTRTSEPRQWLATQQDMVQAAMDRAAGGLPTETRNAWKVAYASQFLEGHDLEAFAESGAALWEMREHRKKQAQNTPAAVPAQTQLQEWMTQALEGLKAIVEEHDGLLVPRSAPTGHRMQARPQAGEATTHVGAELQPAPKYKSSSTRRGTFSDLRMAYEDNRSGVPWKDTRAQESIEKIAKPMMKRLLPEHRAGVLQALSVYGKDATHFFAEHRVQIESIDKDKSFLKDCQNSHFCKNNNGRSQEKNEFIFYCKTVEAKYHFQRWEFITSYACRIFLNLVTSADAFLFGNFILPEMKISPGDTCRVEAVAFHELGHITDFSVAVNMGLQRYKPYNLPIPYPISMPLVFSSTRFGAYSAFPLIKQEYLEAKRGKSGLTRYAETNKFEFFAEAACAYFGSPPRYYQTNVMTPGEAVFSEQNLKMQHPHTFAALDELVRAKLYVPQAKRSLAERGTAQLSTPIPIQPEDAVLAKGEMG